MPRATGTIAKGKSPIDKKKSDHHYNGAPRGSVEQSILTGDFKLPGKTREETIKAYRAWQKDFRINGHSMERWYRTQIKDTTPHADTT